jgi:hypothetical protein
MRLEFTIFELDYSIREWIRLNHYICWIKKITIIEFGSITFNTIYKAQLIIIYKKSFSNRDSL